MNYARADAKAWAQQHLRGVWAAVPTPFRADLGLDEAGWRKNLRHWIVDLELGGFFVGGKQGEFFSMSVAERKRIFDIAVEETAAHGHRSGTILSCSDQNLDTVIDLARHAEAIGADYIVVHAPVLHFGKDVDSTVYEYYRHVASQVGIGIAMWSHEDSGYLMSPELCARIARDIPNIVAIKYSVPREMYARLTRMTRGTLIVSTSSEAEWLDNIVELEWQVYLCSIPPILFQTKDDRRINDYTRLAMAGRIDEARRVRDSLAPVRESLRRALPPGTPQACQKYWQELLGQVGGPVRRPLLPLTEDDRARVRDAFESSGLAAPAARDARVAG
ncbi:MAG: dihydrodipicolinate synthase family protein [Burkholderiales bacterium]|nr:dihydrodipicolinate synthase family protein [Burkholderiales bacterium]MCE7876655.1 dihydrodipicolinate synthase family protein [Betaproteobacteria bacterium PRO3]